jgi:hypothetical protein
MIESFLGFVIFIGIIAYFVWGFFLGPLLLITGKLDPPPEEKNKAVKPKAKEYKIKGHVVPIRSEYDPEYEL